MTAVVICYLIYAPKLFELAKTRHYVTPSDFVQDRFHHRGLSLLVSIIMIITLHQTYVHIVFLIFADSSVG